MRKTFREKYGSKLFTLFIVIIMITVVYPTLITNAKNPSQLSAYDNDWNDISNFAADMDEDQNGKHVIKTVTFLINSSIELHHTAPLEIKFLDLFLFTS